MNTKEQLNMTLANKYRPKTFSEVYAQEVCTKRLINQIENHKYSHVQLFAGNAGCGKTTCARIFANCIDGEIKELDCASNGNVANIREIVEDARVKSLLHPYKVIILDECHAITKEGWISLLNVLEENLPNTIFIFCTTDAQKIPNTILSRAKRLNFVPIPNRDMLARLKEIAAAENIQIEDEAVRYDADTSEHFHFKCLCCQNIFDIPLSENNSFNINVQQSLPDDFLAMKIQTNIWGICPSCKTITSSQNS